MLKIKSWGETVQVSPKCPEEDIDVTRGHIVVTSGATATKIRVHSTGCATVMSGGTMLDVDVASGGLVRLLGGVASNINVKDGGSMAIQIQEGCDYHGTSNGVPFDTQSNSITGFIPKGHITVCENCSCGSVVVGSGQAIHACSSTRFGQSVVSDIVVTSGGKVELGLGAVASVREEGGKVYVERDDSNITFVPSLIESQVIYRDTTAHSATKVARCMVADGGKLQVFKGADVSQINTAAGGKIRLHQNASASHLKIHDNCKLHLEHWSVASNVEIYGKGHCIVCSDAAIVSGQVERRGRVNGAGELSHLGIRGTVNLYSGGYMTSCHVLDCGKVVATDVLATNNIICSGGTMVLLGNTRAENIDVYDGGTLILGHDCMIKNINGSGEIRYEDDEEED